MPRDIVRCSWSSNDPLYIKYHDREWGVPLHDDRKLFEFLVLEGMQAGLSWLTVLKKRGNFRKAFSNFYPKKVSGYGEDKVLELMKDAGIIRNRAKILATIGNARAFLSVCDEFGSFDSYVWQFVGGKPIRNRWKYTSELPTRTAESDEMSSDMVSRGFRFVGSTICYAHMQATGMVNDHVLSCFRYRQV